MMSLESKVALYLELLPQTQDPAGFIESQECDSLLFSGLLGCVPGVQLDIRKAFNWTDGTWHRRPLGLKPCCDCWNPSENLPWYNRLLNLWNHLKNDHRYDPDSWVEILRYRGGSTISRDMLTGLAWYAWANSRRDIAESVVQYALAHWGVMGSGDPARTNIMPGLLATFAWISFKLGGPSRAWLRWIPADFGSVQMGYQGHLQVLHVLLRSQIVGRISDKDQRLLTAQFNRQPGNALYAFAAGALNEARSLLEDVGYWPEHRLPTSGDRAEQWLFQRDDGADWQPDIADPDRVYSGGDFLFVYWLLTKEPT